MSIRKERMKSFEEHNFPRSAVKFFKKKRIAPPIYLAGIAKSDKTVFGIGGAQSGEAVFGVSGVASGLSVYLAPIAASGLSVYFAPIAAGSRIGSVFCAGGAA